MTTSAQIQNGIAFVSALVAIIALIVLVRANIKQFRAARAVKLRQELAMSKSAALDTFEFVRDGVPLIHVVDGIVEELERKLGNDPKPAKFIATLNNDAKRANIVSTGWANNSLADELRETRGNLIDNERYLIGKLKIIPLCLELLVKAMDQTHSAHAFSRLIELAPSQLLDKNYQDVANASVAGGLDWLTQFATDVSWSLFFGQKAIETGTADPGTPSYYAVIYQTSKLVEEIVAAITTLPDKRILRCSEARELTSGTEYTEEIGRYLKVLPLDDMTMENLSHRLTTVSSVIVKPSPTGDPSSAA